MVNELITFKERNTLLGVIDLACSLAKHSVEANSIVKGFEVNVLGKDRDTYCHAIASKIIKKSQVRLNQAKNYKYTAIPLESGKFISITHVGSVSQKPLPATYRQGLLFPIEDYSVFKMDLTLVYTTDPVTKDLIYARVMDCATEEVILELDIPITIKKNSLKVYEDLNQQGYSMAGFVLEVDPSIREEEKAQPNYVISARKERMLEAVDDKAR